MYPGAVAPGFYPLILKLCVFMIRFILLLNLSLMVAAQETATNQVPVVSAEFIAGLAGELRTNNSALWAARARIDAANHNARSIPLWRDPQVMLGGMAADSMMRAEDGDVIYGVEQMLPIFGKEKAARAAARMEIPLAETELEAAYQVLRKDLAVAVYQAALSDELLQLSEEDAHWLDTLTRSVEARFQSGRSSQVEVLQIQNERSKRNELVVNDRNYRESAYVRVNRLLNRSLMAGWERMRLPEVAPPLRDVDKLLELARKHEPGLQVLQKQIEKAEADAEATRKTKRPDLGVGLEARQYSGTGEARSGAVLLKLSLPWFNNQKYKAAWEREKSKVRELESLREDYLYKTSEEIHHMVARVDNARREALIYRDEILPRSEEALRSAQMGWQANRDVFRTVLETRRMLLEARVMYKKAVAEQYSAQAEIVFTCGLGDLEAMELIWKPVQGVQP